MWDTTLALQFLGRAKRELGEAGLAQRLNVSKDHLRDFVSGELTMPDAMFERLVEVMMELDRVLNSRLPSRANAGKR